MTITLTKVVQTCEAVPSQWDAWDAEGQYYYLRYRHRTGTVHAEPSQDESTWTSFPTALGTPTETGSVAHFYRSADEGESGWITLPEFLERAGLRLAPEATVLPPLEEETAMADTAVVDTALSRNDPAEAAAPPVPKAQGTYALFDLPDGGLLLVYRTDDEPDVDKRIPVPAFIVNMAARAASGEGVTPGMLGKLFGGAL